MSVAALQGRLRALRLQVEATPRQVYADTPSRVSGSVGQHVRHVLDHVRSLLATRDGGEVTYDARLRGTRIERDPSCAADELVRACIAVEALDDVPFERPVVLRVVTDNDGSASEVMSSAGREIAYVLQHTIHHSALIAVLLERAGVDTVTGFGYAPSTPIRV